MNNADKVTLTIGQLKKLIKESKQLNEDAEYDKHINLLRLVISNIENEYIEELKELAHNLEELKIEKTDSDAYDMLRILRRILSNLKIELMDYEAEEDEPDRM